MVTWPSYKMEQALFLPFCLPGFTSFIISLRISFTSPWKAWRDHKRREEGRERERDGERERERDEEREGEKRGECSYLIDIDPGLGRSLNKRTPKGFGEFLTLSGSHLPIFIINKRIRVREVEKRWWEKKLRREARRGKERGRRDIPFSFQVTLVASKEDGDVVLVLDPQDLLTEGGDFIKA